uniref:Uncharacterized protein n=1 Tax=Ciona intestinalis TaxID=7719 RepID=H2XN36_CIOIN
MEKRKVQNNDHEVEHKKAKGEDPFAYLHAEQKPMPAVYTEKPVQPKEKKIGQLTQKLVDKLAKKLYDAGKIKNMHEDKDFFTRLTHLEKEFKGIAILLHKQGILPKEFQDLWSDERLLNVVEQLVGPDIAGHPVWNLRTKTPHNEQTTVPWHQDNAYLEPCSLECLQLTAWIPMVDANMVNGCMQVASGGHKAGKTLKHTCCAGGTWYVEMQEKDLDQLGL